MLESTLFGHPTSAWRCHPPVGSSRSRESTLVGGQARPPVSHATPGHNRTRRPRIGPKELSHALSLRARSYVPATSRRLASHFSATFTVSLEPRMPDELRERRRARVRQILEMGLLVRSRISSMRPGVAGRRFSQPARQKQVRSCLTLSVSEPPCSFRPMTRVHRDAGSDVAGLPRETGVGRCHLFLRKETDLIDGRFGGSNAWW